MVSPARKRSPRQSSGMTTPQKRRDNMPLQPSPLRNEIFASSSAKKGRKRARSLGAGSDDPTAPSSTKQVNPRKKRMTIVMPYTLLLTGQGSRKGYSEKGNRRGRIWRTHGHRSDSRSVERGKITRRGNRYRSCPKKGITEEFESSSQFRESRYNKVDFPES